MRKTVFLGLILCLIMSMPAFSDITDVIPVEDLKTTMNDFAQELAFSLPFNSSIGLNWSDANIKKSLHWGVGASFGLTTMTIGGFNKLINYFAPALPQSILNFGGFPIPAWALEGRIGGFGLPIDVGVKFGWIPFKQDGNSLGEFNRLDYFLLGGDVRYGILQDKDKIPAVSVGAGFSYLKGGLGMNAGNAVSLEYQKPDVSNPGSYKNGQLNLAAPVLDVDWSTASLDLKAQISKKIAFITPYFGFGASNGWSKAGYGVKTKLTDEDGDTIDIEELKKFMKEKAGLDIIEKVNDIKSLETLAEKTGWSYRLFGGFSLNPGEVFKIDFTGLYNFRDHKYGFSLGFRLQF